MPRLNNDTKKQIKELPRTDLEDIVLKMASKDNAFFDFLKVHYLDKESGEQELFEKAKSDLSYLFAKRYKGFSEQLQLTNMLSACIKRVNEFSVISKNKSQEANLLVYILDETFDYPKEYFGTCFTSFDYKTGTILRRLINLVKKSHPDYLIEYQEKINKYLAILHLHSNHISTIYNLPQEI
jgi:hypothetical protein